MKFIKFFCIAICIVFINGCLTEITQRSNRKMRAMQEKRKEEENLKLQQQKQKQNNTKEIIELSKEEIELMEKEKKRLDEELQHKQLVEEINHKIKTIDSGYLDDDNYIVSYDRNTQNITINFSNFKGRFPDVRFNNCVAIVQDIYINIKDYLESKNIKNIIFNQIKDNKINYTYIFNMEKMKINEFDKVKSETIHYIRSMDDINRLFDK